MVYLDGKRLDEAPIARHELPPGSYRLRFVNAAESVDEMRDIRIESGKVEKLNLRFKK